MSKLKYSDNLEKIITAIFGVVGITAIVINLSLKGYTNENILDALKDSAGLIVTITVFVIASRFFRKSNKSDFTEIFENYLTDWINQNDYLVCENFDEEGKGKFKKRYCSMVIDHSNLVTRRRHAKDAAQIKEKGAFVYLPFIDDTGNIKNEFEFRFNEPTFKRQKIYRTEAGEVNLKAIIEQFAARIDDNFKTLPVHAKPNPSKKTITVSFDKIDRTEDNAKKLIDIVDFVKTMVLALA